MPRSAKQDHEMTKFWVAWGMQKTVAIFFLDYHLEMTTVIAYLASVCLKSIGEYWTDCKFWWWKINSFLTTQCPWHHCCCCLSLEFPLARRCASYRQKNDRETQSRWQSVLEMYKKVPKILLHRQRTQEKQIKKLANSLKLGIPKTLNYHNYWELCKLPTDWYRVAYPIRMFFSQPQGYAQALYLYNFTINVHCSYQSSQICDTKVLISDWG